jgi:hypothetical protein
MQYEVTDPNGRRFVVTAPEDATPDQVMEYARQNFQASPPDPRMQAAREANSGTSGYIDSLGRAFASGATFGTMDEASAALRTGAGLWGNYGDVLAQERARDEVFQKDNPIMSTVANVAGAVAGPGRNIGMMRLGQQAGSAIGNVLRSNIPRYALAGATGGALQGAGEGQGVTGRLEGAAQGGALGLGLGGALGAGANAVGSVGGRLLHMLGLRNPEIAADRQILRAIERDNAARVAAGLPEIQLDTAGRPMAGPGVAPRVEGQTLIDDLSGRNIVNLGATAANTPGVSMESADLLMQARRAARPDRMAGAVDDAFGGGAGGDVAQASARLGEQRATNAAPLYNRAFAEGIAPESYEDLARFVRDPIGQNALDKGMRVIELEHLARGDKFEPAAFGVTRGKGGRWVAVENETPNVRLLDAVKRGFDEIVEGFRDPTSGRLNLNQYGRAVNDVRATYRDDLVTASPAYGEALQAWSGPSQSLDALARGRQAMTMDPDTVAKITQNLSENDREFFRLGVGRAVADATSDPARAAGYARRLLEDRQMQARLQSAIPDAAQRAQFSAALEREINMAAVERAVSPRSGSQTARLQAGADDMAQDPYGGTMIALLNAAQRGGVSGAVASGLGNLYRRGQGITPATSDALARALFTTAPETNTATLNRLMQRREVDQMNAQMRANLAQQLLRGVGAGGAYVTAD